MIRFYTDVHAEHSVAPGGLDLAELAGFQPPWACQRVLGLSIDRVLIYPALTICLQFMTPPSELFIQGTGTLGQYLPNLNLIILNTLHRTNRCTPKCRAR